MSASAEFDGDVLAVVYQPKTRELLGVYDDGHAGVLLVSDQSVLGTANIDTPENDVDGCARAHAPGVTHVGRGYGLALYAALGCLAYSLYDQECIGSSGQVGFEGRTPLAARWWEKALRSGLARASTHGEFITLQSFIRAGLVFWMAEPGSHERELAQARRLYAPAFAAAATDALLAPLVASVLGELLAHEDVAAWRSARLTPNRRRGRRPTFVTAELEAHVDELYAGLEGL